MAGLREFMYPPITLVGFEALRELQPKRICFGTTHQNALKKAKSGNAYGYLYVPFNESFGRIFPWDIFRNTRGQFGGFFRAVKDADEFGQIESWIGEHSDLVFIRSLFATAVATCEHYKTSEKRSRIGELEHAAKYENNREAEAKLNDIALDVFNRVYARLNIQAIASVPPSTKGTASLPNRLAEALSKSVQVNDLTNQISWNGPKGQIKELGVSEKWKALEKVGLTVSDEFDGLNVLLIDDMYQSGATAHFVASKVREAGADDIHMLAVSKGRRDTDNQ